VLILLSNYQKGYSSYYEIRILLPGGYEDTRSTITPVANVTEEESESEFFKTLVNQGNKTYSSFEVNPDNGEQYLLIAKPSKIKNPAIDPVLAKPKFRGYLVITADLEFLSNQQRKTKIGQGGGIFFTDGFGNILFEPIVDPGGRQIPPELFSRLAESMAGEETIRANYQRTWSLIKGLRINENLYAFAVLPERELFKASRRLGAFVAAITLVTTLAVSALLFVFLRNLIITPITKLRQTAYEIGRGNLEVELNVDRKDEIGELTTSFREMSENLQRSSEQIRYLAYYDTLTNLPNRPMFTEHLKTTLAHAKRKKESLAVMFLDLDNFKQVNDTLGHSAGDDLLKEMAGRLVDCVRGSDYLAVSGTPQQTVSRVGGDEFLLLLPDVRGPEGAIKVAKRILSAASKPFVINNYEFYVGVSIGISMYRDDGNNAVSLVICADVAMYHAKKNEKGSFCFYSQHMDTLALKRFTLERDLRKAIEDDQLRLLYQPLVDCNTGALKGVEALVRWEHPREGLISPASFIPPAEDTGLIIPLGGWVLRNACLQAKAWRKKGFEAVKISVNVSYLQFRRRGFAETVQAILKETNMPSECLDVELTESSVMQAPADDLKTLETIKSWGVQISMDDFGTSYSSLASLRNLPIDTLKIDRSFVNNVISDKDDAVIVTVIINMARLLKLKVVAEGVETVDQLKFLQREGCDTIQGFLISRPISSEEIEQFVTQESAMTA
jgi:diguanylate cyclase (GGDEF)-like protein